MGAPNIDFFISYTKKNLEWAKWIAFVLETADYTTLYQDRDFNSGGNFVVQMHDAMQQTKRTIAVLSPAYLEARYTLPEWAEAVRLDPTGKLALLVPIRVEECNLDGLLAARSYIDLVGLDESEASKLLVERIRNLNDKPASPPVPVPFPGTKPVAAKVIAPTGLPRAFSLVGREAVLEDLMEKLRAGDATGVFALEGMGGVGKTALAAEAVAQLAEDQAAFPGGAAWISAEGLKGEEGLAELWARVARALGHDQVAAQPQPQQRRDMLRAALSLQQRMLLALDNLEPKLDAATVLDTLSVPGHTVLLLTARQKVTPYRLRAIELAPLPSPDGASLFRERLGQIDATRPSAQDEAVLPKLLEAVGGLPLAIELTAAYAGAQHMALEVVLREMEQDGINASTFSIDPTAPTLRINARRSLKTRFERSWQVLGQRQQRLFASLTLLEGASFPRKAASALARAATTKQAGDPEGEVLTLISYALVEVLPGGERLRLHPLLREYATQKYRKLPAAQRERLGEAMMSYWLEFARTNADLTGLDAMAGEVMGLMGAVMWTREQGRHQEFLALVRALSRFLFGRGRIDEARLVRPWAVEAAQAINDPAELRWSVHERALLEARQGQMLQARDSFERAIGFAQASEDLAAERLEVHALALAYSVLGQHEAARDKLERALQLARQRGDVMAEWMDVHALAMQDDRMGHWTDACEGYEQAYELAQHLTEPAAEQRETYQASQGSMARRCVAAYESFEQALEQLRQLDEQRADPENRDHHLQSSAYIRMLKLGRAVSEQAIIITQHMRDIEAERVEVHCLALLDSRLGQWTAAVEGFERALKLAQQLGDPAAEADELGSLGIVVGLRGEPDRGRMLILEAMKHSEQLNDHLRMGIIYQFLAWLDEREGNREAAINHYHTALSRFEQAQLRTSAARTRASLRRLEGNGF